MSKRIQRRRTKGWRMPANAVFVGRPTKWGNPYAFRDYLPYYGQHEIPLLAVSDFRHGAIERRFIAENPSYPTRAEIVSELGGKDLVCWCPLDQPCHADVLLELLAA